LAGAFFAFKLEGEEKGQLAVIDHDRLFKELIRTYFEEFMLLFFPQLHEAIDFGAITFLSEEVFTNYTHRYL
jgi:hypothetical protein